MFETSGRTSVPTAKLSTPPPGVIQFAVNIKTSVLHLTRCILRLALEDYDGGIAVGGRMINNLHYADDTTLLAGSASELENLIKKNKSGE